MKLKQLLQPGLYRLGQTALIASAFLLTGQVSVAAEQGQLSFQDIFNRQAMIDKGYDLPPQYDVSIVQVHSSNSVFTKHFQSAWNNGPLQPGSQTFDIPRIDAIQNNTGLVFSDWVLPFLKLYAGVGYTTGKFTLVSRVNLTGNVTYNPATLTFFGNSYALGGSTAYGYHNYFVAADINYFRYDLNVTDQKTDGFLGTLRMGKKFDYQRGLSALWVGAEHNRFTHGFLATVGRESFTGYNIPPNYVALTVSLGLRGWGDEMVGASFKLTDNLSVVTEYRFDSIRMYVATLSYDFGK